METLAVISRRSSKAIVNHSTRLYGINPRLQRCNCRRASRRQRNSHAETDPIFAACGIRTGSVGDITLSTTEKPLQTQEQRDDPAKKKQKPKYCIYRPRQE